MIGKPYTQSNTACKIQAASIIKKRKPFIFLSTNAICASVVSDTTRPSVLVKLMKVEKKQGKGKCSYPDTEINKPNEPRGHITPASTSRNLGHLCFKYQENNITPGLFHLLNTQVTVYIQRQT